MKVLSLFDGISCGRLALERAGIPVERYVAYEINENAIKISKANWNDIEYMGDVMSADFTQYKGFDAVIGGSPCTWWSIARSSTAKHKRETICEGLGWTLFLKFVEAVKATGCKYFLYENNFSISKEIKAEITKQLGVNCVMINSNLVSAQNRKRCYWTNIPFNLPEDKGIDLQNILETEYNKIAPFKVKQTPSRIRMWNDGKGRVNGAICCDNITNKHKSGTVASKQDRNYNAGLIQFEDFCRFLTYSEQERLQTLPDGYTDVKGVTGAQRSLAIGNGWTVDVIAHILRSIPEEDKN